MRRAARIALQVALVLIGLAVALFFAALLTIADCIDACQARGERAVAAALVASGLGLALAGTLGARGPMTAAGAGLALAGVLAAGASLYLLVLGEGAWHRTAIVGGVGAIVIGLVLVWRA